MHDSIKKNIILFVKGWGVTLGVAVLIATSFKSAIAELNHVPTGSMKPTILEGDRLFVNKLAYDLKIPFTTIHLTSWSDPQRGDIVVFNSPTDGTRLVKRVIGLPGDIIALYKNMLLVNNQRVSYDRINVNDLDASSEYDFGTSSFLIEHLTNQPHAIMLTSGKSSLDTFTEIKVPENQYFMMGDNRDNSADSRFFGFVDRDNILGKAPAVVYSLDASHWYFPRLKRFFTSLS